MFYIDFKDDQNFKKICPLKNEVDFKYFTENYVHCALVVKECPVIFTPTPGSIKLGKNTCRSMVDSFFL